MVKVSVVIPVYNVEKYLPACLDSVLSQSLWEIEVICIDDKSPDRCGQILDDYAARDQRVQVIHLSENRRQGYGRNRGLDQAVGKYIYFLDSDDMITPTALEELYELSERDNLRAVFFDSQVIYDSEALAKRYASYPAMRQGNYPDAVLSGPALFDLFMKQDEWTCYVQRQFWDLDFIRRNGIRFPDGVEHEDELFPFEGLLLADRVRYVPKDYFVRRYREDSVMTTPPTAKNFHGYFMNFVKMDAFYRKHNIYCEAAERNIARMEHLFSNYYKNLRDKYDLTEWFREDELPLFYFFDRLRRSWDLINTIDANLLETLRQYSSVYIYGAGTVGLRALYSLSDNGVSVNGVLVTKAEGNPPSLLGHQVIPIKELRADRKSTIIVLTMTSAYISEVRPLLEADGWTCVPFLKRLQ